MSKGSGMHYFEALELAAKVRNLIEHECDRVEIAGSLRRQREFVNDIELVAIPKEQMDLFGDVSGRPHLMILCELVKAGYKIFKSGPHYIQADLGPCKLDLFLTTPEQWGVIFLIRTGSAVFSHNFVTPAKWGGMLPDGFHVSEGRLWNGDEALNTPEEKDVFQVIGLDFVDPIRRG